MNTGRLWNGQVERDLGNKQFLIKRGYNFRFVYVILNGQNFLNFIEDYGTIKSNYDKYC